MQTLGALQLLALTALAGALVGGCVAAGVVGRKSGSWKELPPESRLRRVRFWALFPVLLGGLLALLAVLPSALDALGIAADHCRAHANHHFHLCLVHATHLHPTLLGWIALAALGAVPAAAVGRAVWRTYTAQVRLGELVASGERRETFVEIPAAVPFAFSFGLFDGETAVSRGLVEALDEDELEVVRAHERTHAQRGDVRWSAVVRALTAIQLPAVREWLRAEHELACDEISDRRAAEEAGSRLRVAELLVKIERLTAEPARPAVVGAAQRIGGEALERRVRGLVEAGERSSLDSVRRAAWVFAVGFLVFHYQSIHHFLETVFSYVHGTLH